MTSRILVACMLLLPAVLNGQTAPGAPTRITTTLAGDRRVAGLFAERIRFLAGDRGRPHVHSADLHVTILRGRTFLAWGTRFDTAGARILQPGDFVVLPAGRPHFEWVEEESEIHVQGVGPVSTEYLDSIPRPGR